MVVRVNDRGPFVAGRMLDVSERVAKLLVFNGGMARVRLDYLGKAGAGGRRRISARCWPSLRTGAAYNIVGLVCPPCVRLSENGSCPHLTPQG